MTFFLNSHLGLSRSLRSNDIWPLNFEAATSKFGNHSLTFVSSLQRGKVDLCMTNGSKVLIYLTLLYFIFYCTLVQGVYEVRSQTLFYDFQNFEVAASKFRGQFSFDLNDLERPK